MKKRFPRPGRNRPRPALGRRMPAPLRTLLLLACTALPAACSVSHSAVTGQKRMYAMNWSQEVALGREHDATLIEEFGGVYDDPALTAYVTRVGEAVLAQSHLRRADAAAEHRDTRFTFRVLDSPVVNAFALPGGYVYVTRGILAHMQNEAQLATVLGHEIAHVAARHTSQRLLKAQLGTLGLLGAALVGEALWKAGGEIFGVGAAGFQLVLLQNSRGDERESDRLGVEYAARAGYRVDEGARFFTVFQRMQERAGWLPGFLSSHPDPGRREQTILQLASQWEQEGVHGTDVGQDAFYASIDGMTVGEDPRHGLVEAGSFHHPARRIRFAVPSAWQVAYDRSRVQMTDGDRKAVLHFRQDSTRAAPREAAARYVRDRQLRVVREQADRAGGNPAYYVVAEPTQGDTAHTALLYWVAHGGETYLFGGIASRADFTSYERLFLNSMRSFDEVRDPRILGVQPQRLRIETVRQSTPFRALVPAQLPPGFSAEELALLNQVRLDDTIEAGTRVKLPRP